MSGSTRCGLCGDTRACDLPHCGIKAREAELELAAALADLHAVCVVMSRRPTWDMSTSTRYWGAMGRAERALAQAGVLGAEKEPSCSGDPRMAPLFQRPAVGVVQATSSPAVVLPACGWHGSHQFESEGGAVD